MKPNMKNIRLYTIDMFTRIGNKCLFFSIDDKYLEIAETEVKKGHKVHIFDLCETSIIRNLSKFIDNIPYEVKVYIHIPKTHMHLADIVKDILSYYDNVRMITEKFGPVFSINHNNNNKYHALYRVSYYSSSIVTSIDLDCYTVNKNPINMFSDDEIKELISFKDSILREFKKNCPPGILASFKNDEEIIEYIFETSDISISVKEENE